MSKNIIVISKFDAIVLIETILANLENWLTTTKIRFIPFHFGSYIMKSMETFSHGSFRIQKGL
jgi:hypothetical protein